MSTDLQQLPPIKLSSLSLEQHEHEEHEHEEECVTPTSPESKIPVILTCPPPPKKQKHFVPSCKRRLTHELHFFEIVAKDEVDAFFKSSYELISKTSKKRR